MFQIVLLTVLSKRYEENGKKEEEKVEKKEGNK